MFFRPVVVMRAKRSLSARLARDRCADAVVFREAARRVDRGRRAPLRWFYPTPWQRKAVVRQEWAGRRGLKVGWSGPRASAAKAGNGTENGGFIFLFSFFSFSFLFFFFLTFKSRRCRQEAPKGIAGKGQGC